MTNFSFSVVQDVPTTVFIYTGTNLVGTNLEFQTKRLVTDNYSVTPGPVATGSTQGIDLEFGPEDAIPEILPCLYRIMNGPAVVASGSIVLFKSGGLVDPTFEESVTDLLGGSIVAGDNVNLVFDDSNNRVVINAVIPELPAGSGKSAYDIAVENGFVGTESEWLESLNGMEGSSGPPGMSAYDLAVSNGYVGSPETWLNSLVPQNLEARLTNLESNVAALLAQSAPTAFTIQNRTIAMNLVGNWLDGVQGESYTTTPGDSVTFAFYGTRFEVFAVTSDRHGQMDVIIDGINVGVLDQYSTTRTPEASVYTSGVLANSEHIVHLVNRNVKNVSALEPTSYVVTIDKIVTTGTGIVSPAPSGPVVEPVTSNDPPTDGPFALDEQFTGSYALTPGNNGTHPTIWLGSAANLVSIDNGTMKVSGNNHLASTKGIHNMWSRQRYGGPGKVLRVRMRARLTALYDSKTVGGGRGAVFALHFPADNTGLSQDSVTSVADRQVGTGWPAEIRTHYGLNENGKLEGVRADYDFKNLTISPSKTVGYTTNAWRDITLIYNWLPNNQIRTRLWHNKTGIGTPIFDWTTAAAFNEKAFLHTRNEYCDVEYEYLMVDETDEVSTGGGTGETPGTNNLVLLNEQFNQNMTVSYGNPGPHPTYHLEWSGLINPGVNGSVLSVVGNSHTNSYNGYHRGNSKLKYGGAGKPILIKARMRGTRFYTTEYNGTYSGVKLGMKFPQSQSVTGYSKDDPRSVMGGRGAANPANYIFVVGISPTGRMEIARHPAGDSTYSITSPHFKPYTVNTWLNVAVRMEQRVDGTVNIRVWHDHDMLGSPLDEYDGPGISDEPGFIWFRNDFSDFEYDWITVEDLTATGSAPPTGTFNTGIIPNGRFESNITGWTAGDTATTTVTRTTTGPLVGTGSMRVYSAGGGQIVAQTDRLLNSITAGRTYNIGATVKSIGQGRLVHMQADWGIGSSYLSSQGISVLGSTSTNAQLTGSVTAPANADSVRIKMYSTSTNIGDGFLADDVYFRLI